MKIYKLINKIAYVLCVAVLCLVASSTIGVAQKTNGAGGIKGKVRATANGKAVAGATVTVLDGEREVATATTNDKGDFVVNNLPVGTYTLTFRKPGLRVGSIPNVAVKSGKTVSLRDTLELPIDEGTLAFVRGSVFNEAGRSVSGVRVEIARVEGEGIARRLNAGVTGLTGEFAFRLAPEPATYRVTIKADGAETETKDVTIESAAIYRIAFTLRPKAGEGN